MGTNIGQSPFIILHVPGGLWVGRRMEVETGRDVRKKNWNFRTRRPENKRYERAAFIPG